MLELKMKLKEYLEDHKIPPKRVAQEVAGINLQTLYAYLNGSRKPSLEALTRIAEALIRITGQRLEPQDLMEFQGEPEYRLEITPSAGGKPKGLAERLKLPPGAKSSEVLIAEMRAERDNL